MAKNRQPRLAAYFAYLTCLTQIDLANAANEMAMQPGTFSRLHKVAKRGCETIER